MSIAMAEPGRFVVVATFERTDGTRWEHELGVVAFDRSGMPLVADDRGLVEPDRWGKRAPVGWYLESVDRMVIPAAPGWIVDQWDGVSGRCSMPVVAWIHEPAPDGDAAGKAVCAQVGNRGGNVALEEVDLTERDVQVRLMTAEEAGRLAVLIEEAPAS